jgi:uncharacterized protein YndB with AHSA1/START domain
MPKQKDFKRLVRSRMKKTGESYTAARARLARPKNRPTPPPDLATLARMSDSAIRAKTGKSWAQWVRVLDAIDAVRMPHREIASHVRTAHGIDSWWAQTVTVGYERIRGLREVGQRRGGAYEFTKSRTLPVPVAVLYRAFTSPKVRARWLGDVALTVRKATPNQSIRITWPDRTRVEVRLTPKGEKSQASITHAKLASRETATKLKAWWHERLDALATVLTG